MKNRRKVAFVLIIALVAVLFAACGPGTPHTLLTMDPVTGAGTRTFAIEVPKNDVPEVDNNFGPEGNIPDVDAFVELFRSNAPDYCEIEAVDHPNITDEGKDAGYYSFELTFTFTDLNDYNTKLKEIITAEVWDTMDVADTTITSVEENGSVTYTLHEDARSISLFAVWASTLAFNDTTGAFVKVWDIPTEANQMITETASTFTVNFGGETTTLNLAEYDDFEVSVTKAAPDVDNTDDGNTDDGSTDDDNTDSTGNADTSSPKTGDSFVIYAAIALMMLAAAGAVIVLKRGKNNA